MSSESQQQTADAGASFIFTQFGGMDTSAARQAIDDTSFSWLENVVPIGDSNMPVIPPPLNVASGWQGTAVSLFSVTIGGVVYMIVQTKVGGLYNIYVLQLTTGGPYTPGVPGLIVASVPYSYFASWNNQYLLYVNSSGYNYWDPVDNAQSITEAVVGGPIAVWGGRVWIAGGTGNRTLTYTAPDSISDFTEADAGGDVVINVPSMQGGITSMQAAGDWLYVVGPGCIVALSEIQVVDSAPPLTLFNVTTISDISGCSSLFGTEALEGTLILLNGNGVGQYQGMTPSPGFSSPMSGFMADVNLSMNQGLCITTLFSKLVLLALVYYTIPGPLGGNGGTYYFMAYMEGKWFLINPNNSTVAACAWAVIDSAPQAYYTDGLSLYEVAGGTGLNSGIVQTKLYDGSSPITIKEVRKHGIEVELPSLQGGLTYTLDCLNPSNGLQQTLNKFPAWNTYTGGYNWLRNQVSNYGTYFGSTLNFNLEDAVFNSIGYNVLYGMEWP